MNELKIKFEKILDKKVDEIFLTKKIMEFV